MPTLGFAGYDVEIARDCHEAIMMVKEKGVPYAISFDHDLGAEENGESKRPP